MPPEGIVDLRQSPADHDRSKIGIVLEIRPNSQIRPRFASKCLASAEHVFDLADTSPLGNLTTTAPFDFYGETEWRDDLELGATELYSALTSTDTSRPAGLPHGDPMFYLPAAAHWAHAYITGPNDAADTLNLYDVSGLAHFELFRALSLAGGHEDLEVPGPTSSGT